MTLKIREIFKISQNDRYNNDSTSKGIAINLGHLRVRSGGQPNIEEFRKYWDLRSSNLFCVFP